MNYSVSMLQSKSDCDTIIGIAKSERDGLIYRKTGLERQLANAASTSVEIDTNLASATAELNALQSVVDGLPEGPTKDETQRKIKKVEYRKFLLEERKDNYGVLALLEKEYDIACLQKNVEEAEAFITSIEDKKATLN